MDPSTLPLYKFEPLEVQSVRLLIIEKDAWDAPFIRCRFQHQSIPEALLVDGYDAVSYVWGKPNFTSYIILDNQGKLPVTDHLYNILRKLRQTVSRRLWIDAVCINQQDDIEKSAQLGIMHMIYSAAEVVHIVLGDHLTIRDVHLSTFWERRWVVQEVLLATYIQIHLSLKPRGRCLDLTTGLSQSKKLAQKFKHNQAFLETMNFKLSTGKFVLRSPNDRVPLRMDLSIFGLLLAFRKTECVDDRDRIFALLAAATDICSSQADKEDHGTRKCKSCSPQRPLAIHFRADYSLSTEHIYMNFAKKALSWPPYQYLVLDYAVHLPNSRRATDDNEPYRNSLPSWVPDWRVRDRDESSDFFGVLPAIRCSANPFPEYAQVLLFESNLLICQAFVLGTYRFDKIKDHWTIKLSKCAIEVGQRHLGTALTDIELFEDDLEEASCKNPENGDILIWIGCDPHMTILRPSEGLVISNDHGVDQLGTLIGRLQKRLSGSSFWIHPNSQRVYELWVARESELGRAVKDTQERFRVNESFSCIGII